MTQFTYNTLTLILIVTCALSVVNGSPYPTNIDESLINKSDDSKKIFKNEDQKGEILVLSSDQEEDMDNQLFPYDPLLIKNYNRNPGTDLRKTNNVINSNLFGDLEREAASEVHQVDSKVEIAKKKPPTLPVAAVEPGSTKNQDLIKSIAFNSREIRLMGPDKKEVEMKDDVGTQLYVALDNLQKDASDVWGQVSDKLDKGWTDLKKMVEGAVASSAQKKASSARSLREASQPSQASSIVVVSDVDGYSMADEESSAALQADSVGTKVQGFLSNIGINEDNQKKASDAVSKAGTAVSDTVTKDLPDALKKAGNAVSDTVTKDIPDAFKNFFG